MGLKNDYYLGKTGLLAQMDAAFAAGVAYVGGATAQNLDVDFGSNGGAAFVTGAAGLYFDVSSPSQGYRMWFQTGTESAPSAGINVLVPINVLSSDSPAQVVSKAAAAINLITDQPLIADPNVEVLSIINNLVGPGANAPSAGTAPVTITVNDPGAAASGNYAALQAALVSAAQQGLTHFTVTLPATYMPQFLRGSQSKNCWPQNQYNSNMSQVSSSNSNYGNDPSDNLIRKSFFAGIHQGLADNQIYDFECALVLNTSDQLNLGVDFNFMFQTK